jgi:SAM-dependent methyltransferase
VELHPLAQQFAAVAEAYERGRPEYVPAVVGATAAELGLAAGSPVLDLAAGTGKLTRALVGFGFDVIAVEPQPELRRVLAGHIGSEHALDGVAEAIPLPEASVAAVTVADAFHWFDRGAALEEIRRVLRPGGGLALFNTVPDWNGASWAHELGQLVAGSRPEHPHFDGRPWQDYVRDSGGWREPWELVVTNHPRADTEGVLAHMASMSWIAGMDEPGRSRLLDQMRAVVEKGETPERLTLHIEIGLTRLGD